MEQAVPVQPRVFLAGDSTMQTYAATAAPQAGWGQFIADCFSPAVAFHNHAIGGRSSKTFIEEGRLDAILADIAPGDYLFTQMGHNDSTASRPERHTDPATTFREYLQRYVAGARGRGAVPVLLTPVGRLHWEAGVFQNDFRSYCEAVRAVAAEEAVPLIDLMARSLAEYAAVGYDEARTFFMVSVNGTDHTHFTAKGARRIARLVAQGVAALDLPLAEYVRAQGQSPLWP